MVYALCGVDSTGLTKVKLCWSETLTSCRIAEQLIVLTKLLSGGFLTQYSTWLSLPEEIREIQDSINVELALVAFTPE